MWMHVCGDRLWVLVFRYYLPCFLKRGLVISLEITSLVGWLAGQGAPYLHLPCTEIASMFPSPVANDWLPSFIGWLFLVTGGILAVFLHCPPSVYLNPLFLGLPSDWIKALLKDLLLTFPPL